MKKDPSLIKSSDPWTPLWRSGVLHSCSSGIAGNYDKEILDFWLHSFNVLKEKDVLADIGTGNGAIPLLAMSYARTKGLSLDIHGLDIANINPAEDIPDGTKLFDGIQFHPRTSMTRLPFNDGEIGLLCSQFAFEYAERTKAASEILRVIGKNGHAAMIVHSTDSVIMDVSKKQETACNWLIHGSDLLNATTALLETTSTARTPEMREALGKDPLAESVRQRFNLAANELMKKIEEEPSATLLQQAAQRVSKILKASLLSHEHAKLMETSLHAWLEDEGSRISLMQATALDASGLEDVSRQLGNSGLPVRTDRLLYGGSACMGWTINVGNQ